jgi:hypothetical protein
MMATGVPVEALEFSSKASDSAFQEAEVFAENQKISFSASK